MTAIPVITHGTGRPSTPGIYACRQWYGWRILQWHNREWWHDGLAAKWPSEAKGCEIELWCGPLPFVRVEHQPKPVKVPEPMEYDL